jgi:hypothetical protein
MGILGALQEHEAPDLVVHVLACACVRRADYDQRRGVPQVLFERCVVFGSGEVLFVSEDVEPPTRNAEIARRQVPFERGLELRREQTVTSRVADERVVDAARRRRAARRGGGRGDDCGYHVRRR